MTIRLETEDVAFLETVIRGGNQRQADAARARLDELMHLDSMADTPEVKLDSREPYAPKPVATHADPVEQARLDMIERHQNAWRPDYKPKQAAEPVRETSDDPAEQARLDMIQRHQDAWKMDVSLTPASPMPHRQSLLSKEEQRRNQMSLEELQKEADEAEAAMRKRAQEAWKKPHMADLQDHPRTKPREQYPLP